MACPDQLIYQRPYEDAWGTLHDPTTEWDELLKNYRPWVMLLQVGDGSRRMARPASIGASQIIHKEQRHCRQAVGRISKLEADYLDKTSRGKHWKRRQKKKLKVESSRATVQMVVTSSA